ncbi:MAG: hypothetical protein AAB434_04690 [Planctomycetota bacterium]
MRTIVGAPPPCGKLRALEPLPIAGYNPAIMSDLHSLTDATFDEAIQTAETPVLVEFWNHG